jgi:hypothetical protein
LDVASKRLIGPGDFVARHLELTGDQQGPKVSEPTMKKDLQLSTWILMSVVALVAFFAFNKLSPKQTPGTKAAAAGSAPSATTPVPPPVTADKAMIEKEASLLIAKRKELDATVWADEIQAQEYEKTLIAFWDGIRDSGDKFAKIREMPFGRLRTGKKGTEEIHSHDVRRLVFQAGGAEWSHPDYLSWLEGLRASGVEIVQTEWHHKQFLPGRGKTADRSVINFTIHARRMAKQERFALTGDLEVTWSADRNAKGLYDVADVGVRSMTLNSRQGAPAFEEVTLTDKPEVDSIPLLVHDLNDDGLSEIFLLQHNVVYWNRGQMKFEKDILFGAPPPGISEELFAASKVHLRAVFGDFTGNGVLDSLVAVPRAGMALYEGSPGGQFTKPAKLAFKPAAGEVFERFSVVTAGDVNLDGHLDAWVTQYRVHYTDGFAPMPFYNATNSFPSYLLLNDGKGGFHDGTEAAGLGAKRTRLTLAASFHDLDKDGDLDLFTVNDYCGVDVYLNDGKGRFTDVTRDYLDETANFGMGHVLADFNNDSELDLFVTGMGSTTARRLEALGLKREGHEDVNSARMKMGYGNRMYLGGNDEGMRQPVFKDSVARSGWSWGCTGFDFGNDGTVDLYVGNGFISAGSCKDYCTRFWTHDVYVKQVAANPVIDAVWANEWQDSKMSWNGFEKNVLFVNEDGTNYFKAGFLMDMGFVYDSRSVVSEDFDGDGRMDLGVVELETSKQVGAAQTFHLYRNVWEKNGNWIGVRLSGAPGVSTMGARITVETPGRNYVGVVVSGDSYCVQHSQIKHFGLGSGNTVKAIHIDWINGRRTTLESPGIGKYHSITAARRTE